MRLILLIVVVLLLVGALPAWPYSAGWGYYPSGGLGTILIILVVLALVGSHIGSSPNRRRGDLRHPFLFCADR